MVQLLAQAASVVAISLVVAVGAQVTIEDVLSHSAKLAEKQLASTVATLVPALGALE